MGITLEIKGLDGWSYRRPIIIDNTQNPNALTDYQVLVTLDTASLISAGKMRSDCGDIMFTDSDEYTPLNYWIESGHNTASTRIWVKVPSIPAGSTKTIYLYYGNPSAMSQSNGAAVFDFFDDFDTLDTNKWHVVPGTSYTVSNSVLKITVGAIGLQSALPFNLNSGYMTEARVQYNTNSESAYSGVLEVASSRFIQGVNSGADAVILYMVDSPSGSTTVRFWIGSGASTGYNIASGVSAFTMTLNTWYILGEETTPSGAGIWRNYSRLAGYSFAWSKNLTYIALGAFHGAGTYNIKDTSYDWVRVRKYTSPEPAITIGAESDWIDDAESGWIDKTGKMIQFRHSLTSRGLEKIDFTLVNDDVSVGQRVRARRGATTFFEGVVYERKKRHTGRTEVDVTAYSVLVLYDRRVVFRLYDTGTTAGAIIRDLASLESGVNMANVDDGPSLTAPWPIENVPALRVMLDVARGTNHYIRMRPGRILFFKPKAVGTPKATLADTNVLAAEYSEDRWKLKNRVIYVGANGQVLADVSEPPGDLPVVVHDPFLTDPAEAQRRANIRLALNREFGRQLRVVVPMKVVEDAGLDLFDTVRVNIPSLGLANVDLYIVEMSFDPREKKYELVLGGRLELFEDYLSESLGGDVASRFGRKIDVVEALGSVSMQVEDLRRRSHTLAQPVMFLLYLKPPLPHQNASNVFQDADGTLKLVAGATSGTVEIPLRPLGSDDLYWRQLSYDIDPGNGSYSVSLLVGNRTLRSSVPNPYKFTYVVPRGSLAEGESALWGATAGTTKEDVQLAVMTRFGLRFRNASAFQVWYPSAKNWSVNLSEVTYFMFWVYSNNDATIYVRLATNDANYFRANTTAKAGKWVKNVIPLSSFSAVGSPSWSSINYLMFEFPAGTFHIDFDYVFAPALNEQITMRVTLSRPNASVSSPIIKNIRLEYGDWLT